jgi:anthranilate phosphoribosyltransferase
MFKSHINTILSKSISIDDAYSIGQFILSGQASDVEIASILTALTDKNEDYAVIAGIAQAMKLHSKPLRTKEPLIDVCGTGGDGKNTFNISSTVALLLSNVMTVAKHGNRSITSKSGSADLYQAMGIPFHHEEKTILNSLSSSGFAFLFAPKMHPNMHYVMPIRKALPFPTVFNIIGPLCNPFNLEYQIVGVYKESLIQPMIQALKHLGVKRAAVVHGHSGLDELSITGPNKIAFLNNGHINELIVDPIDFHIEYSPLESIAGGTPEDNLNITLSILGGQLGPKSDIVALNAGLALFIGEQVSSIIEGVKLAQDLLMSGVTIKKIKEIQ